MGQQVITSSGIIKGSTTTLYKTGTSVEIINNGSESALFSYSVPGGLMGANGALRLTMIGDFLNNTGGNVNLEFAVILGATTLWRDDEGSFATGTARRPWRFDALIGNQNSQSVQFMGGTFTIAGVNAATTGIGEFNSSAFRSIAIGGSAAEDTSAAKTLAVNFDLDTVSANNAVRCQYALLEVL